MGGDGGVGWVVMVEEMDGDGGVGWVVMVEWDGW